MQELFRLSSKTEGRRFSMEELFKTSTITPIVESSYACLNQIAFEQEKMPGNESPSDLFNKLNSQLEDLIQPWIQKVDIVSESQGYFKWEKIGNSKDLVLFGPNNNTRFYFFSKDYNSHYDQYRASIEIQNGSYPPICNCSLSLKQREGGMGITTGNLGFVKEEGFSSISFFSSRFDGKHIHTINLDFQYSHKFGAAYMDVEGSEKFMLPKKDSEYKTTEISSSFKMLEVRGLVDPDHAEIKRKEEQNEKNGYKNDDGWGHDDWS